MTLFSKRWLPALVPAALALAMVAGARTAAQDAKAPAEPPKAPEVKELPPTDYRDFVFLASDRPVLIRLHLLIDGKPYYSQFDEYMKKLFEQFDRNNDGFLSQEEMNSVPNAQFLMQHLQGAIGIGRQGQKINFADVDTNKDGKISPEEFASYYRRNGFTSLRFGVGSAVQNTERINDAILKHLGAEKDGKLTKEIVAKAPEIFARLDMDEDEMITAEELAPRGNRNPYGFATPLDGGGPPRRPAQDTGVIDIVPGQPLDAVAKRLLDHYDKSKKGKLTREEIGLPKELFDELDANKDGNLDAAELVKFFQRDSDLELVGRLGKITPKESAADTFIREIGSKIGIPDALPNRVEIFNPTKRPMRLASTASRIDDRMLALKLGDATIELQTQAVENAFNRFQNIRQFYQRQFDTLDVDKKGVIDKKQAMQDQFIREIFDLADRNGDGKLTTEELKSYFDLQTLGANCTATVQGSDLGRSLFDLFDADRDNRLSVREIRTAWSRMEPYVKAADGSLTKADVPRRLTFALGQGQNTFFAGRPVNRSGPAAPLWFTKMDRNNDGDLSPREFLGTEEEFRMLDADGDGLISIAEALQWEARQKKERDKKKDEEKKP
jgi:Ca2+-binding EF-hand superfamily protein